MRGAARTLILFAAILAGCGDDGGDDDDAGDTADAGDSADAGDGADAGEPADTSCCDPEERPGEGGTYPCIEGASCCADGEWRCNEGDGEPTCDSAGGVCEGGDALLLPPT